MDRTTISSCGSFRSPARCPFARQPHPTARHSSGVLRTTGASRAW